MSVTDSSADIRDFGSQAARDLRGFLVASALRRFAHGRLSSSDAPGPAMARRALEFEGSQDGGGLLRVVCDLWGVALGAVARESRLEQAAISSYVLKRAPLSVREIAALTAALHDLIGRTAL